MCHVKENVVVFLTFEQVNMYQVVVFAVGKRNDQFLHQFRNFFVFYRRDRDFDFSGIVSEQCIIFLLSWFDDSFQTRMRIQNLIAGFPHTVQIYALVQLKCKREISCGISRNHIGKIHLQTGKRIDRTDR